MRIGVIGAGPGGAAAALALARRGVDVTIHLPAARSEKPCGGALPAYLLAEIEAAGLDGLPVVEVGRATVENAAGRRVDLSLEGLRIYRRADFDAALLAAAVAAGAGVCRGKALQLTVEPDGVRVCGRRWQRRYDWLVAADGACGLSRRSLGLQAAGDSVGLGASLESATSCDLILAFPDLADAYLWIFPRPGGVSAGIAYGAGRLSDGAARACLEAFLNRHLPFAAAAAPGKRYRYPIPTYSARTVADLRRAAARRLLLVGDAAGLADPLTREGIRPAVRSGVWAADCLAAGRPADFPQRVSSEMGAEMARAERACRLFYDGRIAQWMVPVSRTLPGVRATLADLLGCRQPYRGLRRRLLGSCLPRARARAGSQLPNR